MKKKENDAEIHALAKRIVSMKEKAKKLDMFIEDRELLSCPKCGLEEDVASQGFLIVSYPSNSRIDSGLRFEEVKNCSNRFRCPACGMEFSGIEALN